MDCAKNFCDGCNELLHKSAKRQGHQRNTLTAAPSLTGASSNDDTPDMCAQCSEQVANVSCVECTKLLCDGCNSLLHRSAARAEHTRIPIGGNGDSVTCEQCDEGASVVKCDECSKKLCDACNTMLHRSAKRATHNRVNL